MPECAGMYPYSTQENGNRLVTRFPLCEGDMATVGPIAEPRAGIIAVLAAPATLSTRR